MENLINSKNTVLGVEFGSTRIKAVLTDEKGNPVASGAHDWENRYENGVFTYSLDDITNGLQHCYSELKKDVESKYGTKLTAVGAMGFSAMMHGYIALDKEGNLLVPFRTWRNTITGQAAEILTKEFNYNIPQRWSIAHLYQAILNGEEHVKDIASITTLAGYIHWKLTGEKVLGVGDASGMFPIDINTGDYDMGMVAKFNALISDKGYGWKLEDILPKVLSAGEKAGTLTEEGAKFLDPTGDLASGISLCPPEGDAGTGMTATNSVAVKTGNISAGTSVFAMVVLEKELKKVYEQIDLVTTPDGALVAMVHCNNCTSEINEWISLFDQVLKLFGNNVDKNDLFTKLYSIAGKGQPDCGGLISYNYVSGEPVTGFQKGAPLFVRSADADMKLEDVMRMHMYSALAALKSGLDLLAAEDVKIEEMFGHGGYFKTKEIGQRIASAAINAPVSVMETAGEGGPWGMALLASYMMTKDANESLGQFLNNKIFCGNKGTKLMADQAEVDGFNDFMKKYMQGLSVEKAAVEVF